MAPHQQKNTNNLNYQRAETINELQDNGTPVHIKVYKINNTLYPGIIEIEIGTESEKCCVCSYVTHLL